MDENLSSGLLRTDPIVMTYDATEIPPRGLKQETEMILHQAVSMNHQAKAFKGFHQGL